MGENTDEAVESDEESEDSDNSCNTQPFYTSLPDEVFQRADSKTNLVSRCSLLTMQIHKNGGASALQMQLRALLQQFVGLAHQMIS